MDRRVTPARRVTSPFWGPPPPCKQALSSYTFYGGNVVSVLVRSLFFHCGSFSPWWPLAFLIFSPPLQNSHDFLLTKKCPPLFYSSRSSSLSLFFSRWASLTCRLLSPFLSLSLYLLIPNLWTWQSKLNTLDAFPFRLYWLFSCLCLARRGWLCDSPPK